MQKIIVQEEPRVASELIEISISSGAAGRVTLPDVPQLRNQGDQIVIIKTLRLITDKVLTFAPTTGAATTPLADLQKISLVIYSNGWEKGHYIPVLTLNDVADADSTAATTIPYRMHTTRLADWKDLDWNKSYLQFSNGTSAAGDSTMILEVEYMRLQKKMINGQTGYVNIDGF